MNRDIATSVLRNSTVMMTSQVVTWASSFVLMLFLPRYLGSEEYGRLYVAISLTLIAQMVIDFGGQFLVAKEVSRSPSEAAALLSDSTVIHAMLWLCSLLCMACLTLVAGYSREVELLILILGFAKLWEAIERMVGSYFQGREFMQVPSLGAVVERVFVTVTGVAALLLGGKALVIALAMACSTLLNFLVVGRAGVRFIGVLPAPAWSRIKRLLQASLPYFLYSIFSVVYYRIDAVMLSLMTPDAVVGWYGAAYRFFDILMFFPSIFSAVLFPVLARLWGKQQDTLEQTTTRSIECVLVVGVPISLLIYMYASPIIGFFFGLAEYGPSVVLLKLFSIGLVLVYVDFVLGTALFAADKQRPWTLTALVAVFLNPALNLVLIPYSQTHFANGGAGAALATIVTEFFVMSAAVTLLPRGILSGLRTGIVAKALVGGGIMAGASWIMNQTHVFWMFSFIVSAGLYLAVLLAVKTLNDSELRFLRSFFTYQNLRRVFAIEKGMEA